MEKTMKKRRFTKIIACCSALVLMAAGVAGSTMSASAATVRGNYPFNNTENFNKSGVYWKNYYRATAATPAAYVDAYLNVGESGKWTVRMSAPGVDDTFASSNFSKAIVADWYSSYFVSSRYKVFPTSMNLSTTRYTSSGAQQQDNYYTAK